jgi:hypothetical protein
LDARGARAIARLTKREVEVLLRDFDADPISALTVALRVILDRPGAEWPELVAAAQLSDTRAAALLTGEQRTLDGLAAELNELRTLDRG